jgi:hypothetical protein
VFEEPRTLDSGTVVGQGGAERRRGPWASEGRRRPDCVDLRGMGRYKELSGKTDLEEVHPAMEGK